MNDEGKMEILEPKAKGTLVKSSKVKSLELIATGGATLGAIWAFDWAVAWIGPGMIGYGLLRWVWKKEYLFGGLYVLGGAAVFILSNFLGLLLMVPKLIGIFMVLIGLVTFFKPQKSDSNIIEKEKR